MPTDTVIECRDLIDKAVGLLAQTARDLKDARGLISIMEVENAEIGRQRTEVERRPTADLRDLTSDLCPLTTGH